MTSSEVGPILQTERESQRASRWTAAGEAEEAGEAVAEEAEQLHTLRLATWQAAIPPRLRTSDRAQRCTSVSVAKSLSFLPDTSVLSVPTTEAHHRQASARLTRRPTSESDKCTYQGHAPRPPQRKPLHYRDL